MNLKGKYEKIRPLTSLYAVLGLLALAVPLRMYQLLSIIEEDTGFYKAVDWSVYIMYALALLAVIVPYVLIYLSKNVPASKSPYKKSKLLAAFSIIFAVGIIIDVISSFSSFFINIRSFSAVDIPFTAALNQGQIPLLLEAVFGVLAAIYMLVFGISFIDGRTTYSQYKFLAITPLFWCMSRIVLRFVRKIAYMNVSDLMLEIFMFAFMMIFLLAFARISSKLSSNTAMRSLFSSGIVAVFLCTTANLPRLIMVLTGNGARLPDEYPFALCDLGFALFALAYIINSVKCAKENDSAEIQSKKKSKKKAEETGTDANLFSE